MRDGMSTYWRWLSQVRRGALAGALTAGGIAGALAVVWLVGALAPLTAQAATAWQATVGTERHEEGIQGNGFLPNELWIDARCRPLARCWTIFGKRSRHSSNGC